MKPRLARELGGDARSTSASSGWRNSTEKRTSPGITLRLLGETWSSPTVPRPSSPRARIMRSTSSITRAAHSSASLRAEGGRGAGVALLPGGDRVVPDLRLRRR